MGSYLAQIIRPSLHHLMPIINKRCSIIGASIRIPDSMSQLVFDQVNTKPQNFIKNCSRCRPEPVTRYRISVETRVSKNSIEAVIAYRA